jgi:plastocyanin
MRDSICLLLSIFLFSNCSSLPEKHISETDSSTDTSYYIPKDVSPIAMRRIDTVEINDMKFLPAVLTAHKGDTVIWMNRDLVPHCVTEENPKAWTSLPIPAGGSWKMVVTQNSNYYCAIHVVMKGRIVIENF